MAFGTEQIKNLPRTIANGMVKKAKTGSTVAALSGREAMRFGDTDIITFNDVPRAEFVVEGTQKSGTTGSFGFVTAKPRKAQVTMRFNQEVEWADTDHQLGVLETLADAGSTALARALDLGLYHRINPLTGTVIAAWDNYLTSTTNRVDIDTDDLANLDLMVEQAAGKVIAAEWMPNGLALDPKTAWNLSTARFADGRKKFPEIGLGVDISRFEGLATSVSNTVSGMPEAKDTGIRGILGDFQGGIRWGVQRNLPLEVIRYGDPDGDGDLKRHNQIALRLEIVYGWYVFADRFAVLEVEVPEDENGDDD